MTDEKVMFTGFTGKSGNYCPIHHQWVDDDLVNIKKPACIKENNGCGNCRFREHRFEVVPITKVIENESHISDPRENQDDPPL